MSIELTESVPYHRLRQYGPLCDIAPVCFRPPFQHTRSPELSKLEGTEWALQSDLDLFFTRIYKCALSFEVSQRPEVEFRFWRGKGFVANLLSEVFNSIGLLFILLFSGFLLFFVNWSGLRSGCEESSCDISQRLLRSPKLDLSLSSIVKITYLVAFVVYWIGTLAVGINEIFSSWQIQYFCKTKLGISEDQIRWVRWNELVHRLVLIQQTTRLCRTRDLTEHDIVNRILRKENYLIGMINKGVLDLNVPLPGFSRRQLMTKMIEWSLRLGVLNPMFDDNFEIIQKYRTDSAFLRKRLRLLSLANLMLAPFLFMFLVIYFLMVYVERFYHSPSTLTERSWSPHAKWRMRELNEMEHQLMARLTQSQKPAQDYINQFPSYSVKHVGNLVSFVLESLMAMLICVALLDDSLLETGQFLGHYLVWWGAVLVILLKIARGLVPEEAVLDPDECIQEVVKHTHYFPKLWRSNSRSREVLAAFKNMFRYRVLNFVDEVISVLLAPYVLYFSLPRSSGRIVQFLNDYTVRIEGVGDVCSLATFDFDRHGNMNYGSSGSDKSYRSRQGKLEKSFLSFVESYPTWTPNSGGQRLLQNLGPYLSVSVGADYANLAASQVSSVDPRSFMQHSSTRSLPSNLDNIHAALMSLYNDNSRYNQWDKKARQAEKNRETARKFRNKMINLRQYMEDQVQSLTQVYHVLAYIVIKFGKAPEDKSMNINGHPLRRTRTSHI